MLWLNLACAGELYLSYLYPFATTRLWAVNTAHSQHILMRFLLPFLLALLLSTAAHANNQYTRTKVESVTIYHSGALVQRTSDTNFYIGTHQLMFKGVSSKIVLNSLKFHNREVTILNKSIVRKLSEEEFRQLEDQRLALDRQLALIESKYSEAGFVAKVEDLQQMTEFYAAETTRIKREQRSVERKIAEAMELENIQLNNKDAAILKLLISVEAPLGKTMKLQYVCGGVGWSPAYDIHVANGSANSVKVKYLARAMSQTGEDWDNVQIQLSSSFPLESPTTLPKPDKPWVLTNRYREHNEPQSAHNQPNAKELAQIAQLEGVEYEDIFIPSFLKLRTLPGRYSMKSNSTVFTFPVQTVDLPASFYYYGFPRLDPEVYLVGQLTGWDTLGFVDGTANITFNNTEVGKSIIRFSEVRDTLLLPVGKDNSVYMKRSEIADEKFFKTNHNGKKHTTTLAYELVLKNNNSFPLLFELHDQVPIAQSKTAEVELEETSNGTIVEKTGDVVWQNELQPGQSTTKRLIFTIETEGSYRYVSRGDLRPTYQTKQSMPKF